MSSPSPIQANYSRMLQILIAASLTPVEPDPDFKMLLRDIDALERILAHNGYDVLYVADPGLVLLTNVGMKTIVSRCVKYLADKNRTPESETVDTTEQRLVTSIVETIKVKNANYGESWARRGGQGAFFSYVRKTDRLATLVPKYLSGTLADDGDKDDGFDDTFVDMIGYLGLFLDRRVSLYEAQYGTTA